MDYFDKQDPKGKAQENCNQNRPDSYHIAKNVFPDNWKVPQDGDFDFVSMGVLPESKLVLWVATRATRLLLLPRWAGCGAPACPPRSSAAVPFQSETPRFLLASACASGR